MVIGTDGSKRRDSILGMTGAVISFLHNEIEREADRNIHNTVQPLQFLDRTVVWPCTWDENGGEFSS